ncbi:hypothetical protein A2Z23_02330 [Candidatus Curtissbacteria bacterium RBG_16_39_7]|uniref:Type II secretion system protein GspG C-terminal domain-containing protein n=1 Tax=Candidatus Curtissbacteria bacterium RBG_16_39_7 TaxID=1797707 RepID=A0A1F5G2S2_9BACT|nr:MAG: hypothetical protein A2Z23_02330 [Candidatus Curtissbacteria bacterium RBG_16_39_7]
MSSYKANQKGLTLIELLMVIAILSLMASIIIKAIDPIKKMSQARDAKRKMDLAQLRDALSAYEATHGGYPYNGDTWTVESSGFYEGPNGWIPNLAPDSIKILPGDPRRGQIGSQKVVGCQLWPDAIGYMYRSNGTDYKLLAHCTPENYDDDYFVDPWRDADATFGGDGQCATKVLGAGGWAWAVWSSDISRCW